MEKLLKLFGTAAFMLSVTAFAEAAPVSSIPTAAKASPVFLKIPVLKKLLSSTVALGKCRHALPEKEIEHLAEIARRSGGVKEWQAPTRAKTALPRGADTEAQDTREGRASPRKTA